LTKQESTNWSPLGCINMEAAAELVQRYVETRHADLGRQHE
jgi:hypothetical protein